MTTETGRKIRLLPLPPKVESKVEKKPNFPISRQEFEKTCTLEGAGFILVIRPISIDVSYGSNSLPLRN